MSKKYFYVLCISIGVSLGLFAVSTVKPVSKTVVNRPVSPTVTFAPIASSSGQISGTCHARYVDPNDSEKVLPDSNCTPGSISADVRQENVQDTICKSGYSASVRPPTSYTNKLKKKQILEYGYTDLNLKNYEEDHLISLELGGHPTDPKNLWPEPNAAPNEKDKLENYLHKELCKGSITLKQAQEMIATDWVQAYNLYFQ